MKRQLKEIKSIITHPAKAHYDDMVSCALLGYLVHKESGKFPTIFRTRDISGFLNDKTAAFVDIGDTFDKDALMFDHHQDTVSEPPKASFQLLLESFGKWEMFKDVYNWAQFASCQDACGLTNACRRFGVHPNHVLLGGSPFDVPLLGEFESYTVIKPTSSVGRFIQRTGSKLLGELDMVQEHLEELRKVAEFATVNGVKVLICLDMSPHLTALRMLREETSFDISVVKEDRELTLGLRLYRHADHHKVNFSKLNGKPGVYWAHEKGFLARIHMMGWNDVINLLETCVDS